ncbi:MAG: MscL family protein, partial [Butyricicoccus sp.]
FLQNVIDFLIISVCIFTFIKLANKLHSKPAEEPAPEPPAGPTTEELLAEIRDLLKEKH